MPEMPEVQGLVDFLGERAVGHAITRTSVGEIAALKTYDPPNTALHGATITATARYGKFVDIACGDDLHLVFHLAKAGWLRWYDALPTTLIKPGRSPIALRIALDDGSGFDLTEAGTKKSLAIYVVRSPADVPGIATLGPEPMSDDFTVDVLGRILEEAGRKQLKGVLRHQGTIAGIGNAYSDEILHAARMSPYKPADSLSEEELQTLYAVLRGTLADAVARSTGLAASELKGEKKSHLAVHGRTGLPCPVCGDIVREVSFADSSLQYCPTCQTGGKPLADRRMSKLLK